MPTIYIDSRVNDEKRRHRLYGGDLFAFSASESATKLAALARELSEGAFAPHDPQVAQETMPAERYVEILAELKPAFIHHPRAKKLIAGLLSELGCDIERTYFDVPRLRTMAHGEYLKAGLAYQFHAHRDTWFSAPHQQLNWWLPVYEIESENCMAFHPDYFDKPVRNGSAGYDYEQWSKTGRQQAAKQIKKETRRQPQPEEPLELDPDVRVVTPPGGTLIFSAAQLHSTVPNTTSRTRFSIDFRTVNLDDLIDGVAAPNIDSECTGTTLRDFLRASDLTALPEDVIASYNKRPEMATASAS
jgi:Phytanoyl-CoA dioxygenase (PhyH)